MIEQLGSGRRRRGRGGQETDCPLNINELAFLARTLRGPDGPRSAGRTP